MNHGNFINWFENKLKNLEKPSIIMMDNAPYRSVVVKKKTKYKLEISGHSNMVYVKKYSIRCDHAHSTTLDASFSYFSFY